MQALEQPSEVLPNVRCRWLGRRSLAVGTDLGLEPGFFVLDCQEDSLRALCHFHSLCEDAVEPAHLRYCRLVGGRSVAKALLQAG